MKKAAIAAIVLYAALGIVMIASPKTLGAGLNITNKQSTTFGIVLLCYAAFRGWVTYRTFFKKRPPITTSDSE